MDKWPRVLRLFVFINALFLAAGLHVANGNGCGLNDFCFNLTTRPTPGSFPFTPGISLPGPDGGTGQIELTALSGGLPQLASFQFTNTSFLATSVPGGITYQYGTNDVSALSYSIY